MPTEIVAGIFILGAMAGLVGLYMLWVQRGGRIQEWSLARRVVVSVLLCPAWGVIAGIAFVLLFGYLRRSTERMDTW